MELRIAAANSLPGHRALWATAIFLFAFASAYAQTGASLPRLKVDGHRLVDGSGKEVVLKGCNLGGWLMIEPWLQAIEDSNIRDQHSFISLLQSRFGDGQAERLMDVFRANWITVRELKLAGSFGFNLVRVPFDHHLLAADDRPFELRKDAFEWLDKAVELAEQAGMYVIFDMHGVPGGQSTEMPSGYIGRNELWGSEENQKRTAWLWQRIADRYRDRFAVVAYDLINEPWGDFQTDVRPKLITLVDRIHKSVREVDAEKLLFAPGSLRGIGFYEGPAKHGWKNLGFTEHSYIGLFGNGSPSLESHAQFLGLAVPGKARLIDRWDVPYLVGEFNPVFDQVARTSMMRRYYDAFAAHGWAATMWTVRGISPGGAGKPNNWYLATNKEPFNLPDLQKAPYEEIEQAFRQMGSMPLVADEELRKALTSPAGDGPVMADFSSPVAGDPPAEKLTGWTAADVSTSLPGGQRKQGDGVVTLYGAGSDIWAVHDEFRFLHRQAERDFEVRTWLAVLDASQPFAKAGWMLRESLEPDAAHVLISAFPDGRVMLAWRPKRGEPTKEQPLAVGDLPVGMGIQRDGHRIVVWYTDIDGQWRSQEVPNSDQLPNFPLIGLAVSSHDEAVLAAATFHGLDKSAPPVPARGSTERNLLQNGSFETPEEAEKAADRAHDWGRWGQWLNREANWEPHRDGHCVLGYHHWQIEAVENSGVYQDVKGLSAGSRCTFGVYANRDIPAKDKQGPQSVEVRIESPFGGTLLTVASRTYNVPDLASGDTWSHLHVTGTIPADSARVLIIVNPSGKGPRDAALKFDQASFHVEPGKSVRSSQPIRR
jgi:hypothetical protein